MVAWAIPAAVAVGSAIMGYIGQSKAAKSEKEKRELLKKAAEEFQKIDVPEQKQAIYEQLKSSGDFTPEMEKEIITPDSEFAKMKADPEMVAAQKGALAQLQALGESGGVDAMDKANIEQARQRYAAEGASQQAGVQESMARRGIGGSGLELAQRQMAGQNAANQMANMEAQTQGEARRRALQAMVQGGQMAGDIRGQDVNEQARKAQAIDDLNKFRTQNQIAMQTRNVGATNEAGLRNLNEANRVQSGNVGIVNQQQDVNRTAGDRTFGQQIQKAGGVANALGGQATAAGQQAQATSNMWGGLASGIGQAGAAYGQGQSDEADRALKEKELELKYK